MKLNKYVFLVTVLPLLVLAISCNNSTGTKTESDSTSVSAATQSVSDSVTAINQPWLDNKPVSVSIMSDTIPAIIVSDSTAIEHILSMIGKLSYCETSSEVIVGGYPALILEYPGRWICYEVLNFEYIKIISDGSTKEYRIPKEDGQALYDYLNKCLDDMP